MPSVVRFAIPAGVGIEGGIVTSYLLARDAFDLTLMRSRTVSTATVVVCGLATVMRLEASEGRHPLALALLCALMLLIFALAFVMPSMRHFFELSTPTGDGVVAWAAGTAIGIAGMLGGLRLLRP